MKVQVTKQAQQKLARRYPLVRQEDLVTNVPLNQWVDFVDGQQRFLAKGYLGQQNKGAGWVVSWQEVALDQAFFTALFKEAKAKRQQFAQNDLTNAYRVFNAEGDGLGGVTIDLYDSFAVFSWYNETIYAAKAQLVAAFQAAFPEVVGAYEKIRFGKDLPESQHLYGDEAPEPLIVCENGVQYATYLNEGLMTGIFLDQKEVRQMLTSGLAKNKTLLNMFSYTGAFSVAAAVGGATKTTSVDLAKRSLPKTQEQFEVNEIDPQTQAIHVMDTFAYFQYAAKKGLSFDLIVLDPPSFARNKKKTFSVAKDYGTLIRDSLAILNDQGIIVASTNAANLSAKKFKQSIEAVFAEENVRYKEMRGFRLPADFAVNDAFEEGNYLKVYCYQIEK